MASAIVLNIMMRALQDDSLRHSFQSDFEGTLKGMKLGASLAQEDYDVLKTAFTPAEVTGQCGACSYDMSCGTRGAYK